MSLSLGSVVSRRVLAAFVVCCLVLPIIYGFLQQGRASQSKKASPFDGSASWELDGSPLSLFTSAADPVVDFEHTRAFHPPPDERPSARHCDKVPTWQFLDLAKAAAPINASEPFVYHFHNGSVITDPFNQFWVTAGFCTVFFAPQVPWNPVLSFRNQPIEGLGPDVIQAEIASPDVRLVFTDHPRYWGTVSIPSDDPAQTAVSATDVTLAVYTASFELHHPGAYGLNGAVEFQNYDWVMEDPVDLVADKLPYNMTNHTLTSRSPAINMIGPPRSRPTTQCFRDGHTDLRGRWYDWKAFNPDFGNQTALNLAAGLANAKSNLTYDEWGWTFQPDACQLATYGPHDHLECLQGRTLQFLGDSNARRVGKSLMGGAREWCASYNSTIDRFCQCEDHYQKNGTDAEKNFIDFAPLREIERRAEAAPFGWGSQLYFDFVGGLINAKPFNAWPTFFDAATAPARDPVDLVYVSVVVWDVAAVRTPAEVLAALPAFRAALRAAYPPTTRFVHRLANPNCCGNTNHEVRYSAPRFAMFNAAWRAFWAPDVAAGRVLLVDPAVLSGRGDAERAGFFCPPTHLRTSHVRMEAQMWMNAVCEKGAGADGNTTRMRDW